MTLINHGEVKRKLRARYLGLKSQRPEPVNLIHPFQIETLRAQKTSSMGGFDPFGWLSDLGSSIGDVFNEVMNDVVQTVNAIVALYIDTVKAMFGVVDWKNITTSLGNAIRPIMDVTVMLSPNRNISDFLKTNSLTKQTFKELDKFTGGMLTNQVNVSDLVYRSMRGDAISKQELIQDAIFSLQVGTMVIGGPAAIGGAIGNMVGKQVCKDSGNAKDLCVAAFTIIGTAAGSYETAITSSAGDYASDQGQQELANYLATHETADFSSYVSAAAEEYLKERGIDEVTKQAVALCQSGHWLGNNECAILGQIASDYLKTPEGTDWTDFLAEEVAKLGVKELISTWFPPGSKQRTAIVNYVPGKVVNVTTPSSTTQTSGINKGLLLLLAAGAAGSILMGAS